MIEVSRDIICFKENKDTTYDVILVLQGVEFGHNNKWETVSNRKLLCVIDSIDLDKQLQLYSKCNDNVCVEGLA